VRLDLTAEELVREHAADLLARRGAGEQDAQLLVAPMLRGRRELIAGMVRDPQFGPCVMLGLGGIFAEALGDVAFAAAPLGPGDADDLIDALRFANVLGEFRGEPAVDRARLSHVLEALARLGAERPDVRSIDVNPLIVVGDAPVVVDALVELSS
jgi:acetyl-CoA synthetase (ADP-forming)